MKTTIKTTKKTTKKIAKKSKTSGKTAKLSKSKTAAANQATRETQATRKVIKVKKPVVKKMPKAIKRVEPEDLSARDMAQMTRPTKKLDRLIPVFDAEGNAVDHAKVEAAATKSDQLEVLTDNGAVMLADKIAPAPKVEKKKEPLRSEAVLVDGVIMMDAIPQGESTDEVSEEETTIVVEAGTFVVNGPKTDSALPNSTKR